MFTLEKRFQEHCTDSKKFNLENRPLYLAMRKYGCDKFRIELLEEPEIEALAEREQFWISKLNTFHDGYNATLGEMERFYMIIPSSLKTIRVGC